MRILIAVDSFKGSISSMAAASAMEKAIKKVRPDFVCHSFPLADGGEGTLDTVAAFLDGVIFEESMPNAFGKYVNVKRGVFMDGRMAVIELAQASGIGSLTKPDALKASTYGTGLQIRNALEEGTDEIILTLGGSATVDGGSGIMSALGTRFINNQDRQCKEWHNHLYYFSEADFSNIVKRTKDVKWLILADVNNSVLGENGGIRIFGPQKGLSEAGIKKLEQKIVCWTRAMGGIQAEKSLTIPGSGAAGGAALPFLILCNASIINGFDWIAQNFGLEKIIKESDLVITGEGKFDRQTSMGKGPGKIAQLARKHGKKVVAIVGTAEVNSGIFDKIYTLDDYSNSKETLMSNPEYFLSLAVQKMMSEVI